MEKVQIDTDRYSELIRKECLLDIVVGLVNTDNSYSIESMLKAAGCGDKDDVNDERCITEEG